MTPVVQNNGRVHHSGGANRTLWQCEVYHKSRVTFLNSVGI